MLLCCNLVVHSFKKIFSPHSSAGTHEKDPVLSFVSELPSHTLVVGARSSPLSKKQVEEVYEELKQSAPQLKFQTIYVETPGDRDKITALRHLDKTDFFTREIDQLLLEGKCRLGIHSAKDLPDPLPKGLVLGALTRGVDSADVLVVRHGETLHPGSIVATSSIRREEAVKILFPKVQFVDIRGTIGERLAVLERREVDGVVIAEAALIRLGWTHLHRIRLPGDTAPLQGRLALIVRDDDTTLISFLKGAIR